MLTAWREFKDWKDLVLGSASALSSARLFEMVEKWAIFANSLYFVRKALQEWGDQLVCLHYPKF